jgi:two-component system LytT family sensor kinase
MSYLEVVRIAQTSGFAIGTALAALLLVLVDRSGGAGRGPRFLFAVCILIANCTGLIKCVGLLLNPDLNPLYGERMRSIGFAAAALLPYSIVLVWLDNAVTKRRQRIGKWIVWYAASSGILIGLALLIGAWGSGWPFPVPISSLFSDQDSIGNLTFYNGLATFLLGGVVLLPGTLGDRTNRIALSLMLTGLSLSTASTLIERTLRSPSALTKWVDVTRFQSIILLVVGVFFYFSRFRAADVFAKYALRLLSIAVLTTASALLLFGPLSRILGSTEPLRASAVLLTAAVMSCTVLFYTRIGRWIDLFVERRVFGKRDTRLAIRAFRQELGSLGPKLTILHRAQALVSELLAIGQEQISIQPVKFDHESASNLTVQIPANSESLQLAVSLSGNRKTLLTSEEDLLHEIALHLGRRLDDLSREEERIRSVRLKSLLSQQLVEAELRALRAQINPHFLFNSLNTIASLISSEPEKAEKITVRLGSMFRYVLTHSDQPLSSVKEEFEFLRTYLDIEQIRFGERLVVDFDVEPSTIYTPIPSLILQPLVENAIKHGVAPKIGRSRILLRAKRLHESILIDVEDDGVGLNHKSNQVRLPLSGNIFNTGVGLQNIRDRLHTLYGADAKLFLTDLESGGCQASLVIPTIGADNADSRIPGGR